MQYIITEHKLAQSIRCHITISSDSVAAQLNSGPQYRLQWDQLNDVEVLAQVFGELQVRVFAQLVPILGKIHALRDTYLEILS